MNRISSLIIRWKLIVAIVVMFVVYAIVLAIVNRQEMASGFAIFTNAQGQGMSRFYMAISEYNSSPTRKINDIASLQVTVQPISGVIGYMIYAQSSLDDSLRKFLENPYNGYQTSVVKSITSQTHPFNGNWILYYTSSSHPPLLPSQELERIAKDPVITYYSYAPNEFATLAPILYHGNVIGITEVNQKRSNAALPALAASIANNLWWFLLLALLLVILLYIIIGKLVVAPIRYQAEHDLLTGFYNQVTFWRLFEEICSTMKNMQLPLAMILFDMDDFKFINDTFGHQKGDEVLKMLNTILSRHIRKSDVVGRMGGEEFGILLPSCDLDQAITIAETIRLDISNHSLEDHMITVSMGISSHQLATNYHAKMIANTADAALYTAKRTGKNKCVVYDSSMKI